MHDRPLRVRLVEIPYDRACAVASIGTLPAFRVLTVAGPALPGIVHPVALVVVGLHIVDHQALRRGETPHLAHPRREGRRLVDLADLPVVRPVVLRTQGGQGHLARGHGRDRGRALEHRIRVCADADVMPDRLASGPPSQRPGEGHIRSPGGRLRPPGLQGGLEETDLAEAGLLGGGPPVAVHGELDVPGQDPAEVHGGVVHVVRLSRALGELGHVGQGGPRGPVHGGGDGHVPGPVPQGGHLLGLILVPDPHLVQLVDLVKLVLDPRGLGGLAAEPHVLGTGRVLVVLAKPGTIDRLDGLELRLVEAGGRGLDRRDRIGVGLGREAPDLALEDRGLRGRGIDLVDPPVVGLVERQQTGGRKGRARLALAGQHPPRFGSAGRVDVVEHGPEVHVVCGRVRTRAPTQHGLPRNVHRPVRRACLRGGPGPLSARQGKLHVVIGQGVVVELDVVQQARVLAGPVGHLTQEDVRELEVTHGVRRLVQELTVVVELGGVVLAAPRGGHVVPCVVRQHRGHRRIPLGPLARVGVDEGAACIEVDLASDPDVGGRQLQMHGHLVLRAESPARGVVAGPEDRVDAARRGTRIHPERDRTQSRAQPHRAGRDGDEVVAAELHGPLELAGHPPWAAGDVAVVALTARVRSHGARGLIELPPPHQRGLRHARPQGPQHTGREDPMTPSTAHDCPPSREDRQGIA